MTAYEWDRAGDEFTFTWRGLGLGVVVSNIRESRDHDLVARVEPFELFDEEMRPLAAGTKANLETARGKGELVTAFNRRRDLSDPQFELSWGDIIETVAGVTTREYRKGSPFVDLAAVDVPDDLPYLLYPYLPLGEPTLFFGDGASAKSMLMMLLALSVRTGVQIPNCRPPSERGNVAYLDFETVAESQARRLGRVAAGLDFAEMPGGIYYRKCWRPLTEEADKLAVDIKRFKVRLVIVDSLAWACGNDPNDAGVAIRTMAAIRALGVTAAVVAHIPKADRADASASHGPTGSVFFSNAVRSSWEVRSAPTSNPEIIRQALYHRKANDDRRESYPLGQEIKFADGPKRPVRFYREDIKASDPLAAGSDLPERLRRTLARAKSPVTPEQIAMLWQGAVKPAVVRAALLQMPDILQFETKSEDGTKKGPLRFALMGKEFSDPQTAAMEPADPNAWRGECERCHRDSVLVGYSTSGEQCCISCFEPAPAGA